MLVYFFLAKEKDVAKVVASGYYIHGMQRLEFLHVSRFALIASINRVGVSNKVHWVIPGE